MSEEQYTISNARLDAEYVHEKPVPDGYPCKECRERGFIPTVYQDNCPECGGDDPYGQPVYCAQCEFCCGC